MSFAKQPVEARLRKGWSQQELADELGLLAAESISRYERGGRQPRLATLLRLAGVLEVSPEALIQGSATAAGTSSPPAAESEALSVPTAADDLQTAPLSSTSSSRGAGKRPRRARRRDDERAHNPEPSRSPGAVDHSLFDAATLAEEISQLAAASPGIAIALQGLVRACLKHGGELTGPANQQNSGAEG